MGEKLKNIFGIDLRGLAFFRISLAMLIIIDLIKRTSDLEVFYTDSGILPRVAMFSLLYNSSQFSFHLLSGSVYFQAFLFLISGIFALFLLLGFKTRLATFISWILLLSLHIRSPFSIDGGDLLMRLMLFWSCFLPLGACFSVDSALNKKPIETNKILFSFGTAGLLLQIAFMYWFSVVSKLNNVEWINGDAIYLSLSETQYSRALGELLRQMPYEILKNLTFMIIWIEKYGTLLLFAPIPLIRIASILVFVIMHIGFYIFMHLEFFPLVSIVSLIPFIPSSVFDYLELKLKRQETKDITLYFDGDCGFCKKMVLILSTFLLIKEVKILPAQDTVETKEEMERFNSWILADYKGKKYYKFDAFKELVSYSPIFKFLIPLLNTKTISNLGDKIYDKIATNRSIASKFTSFLNFHSTSSHPILLNNLLAGIFIFYVFCSNLHSVNKFVIPQNIRQVGDMLGINQSWEMFTKEWYNLWYVIPATLKDGSEIDLFTNGQTVTWDRPKYASKLFNNRFWQKHLILAGKGSGFLIPYYAKYLCKYWNSRLPQEKQIDELKIYVMYERLFPDRTIGETQKIFAWKQHCL